MLVSERIGQFFLEEGDRLEYTEYGGGDSWVVLLHGQLMPRRMHEPLARSLAAAGLHVVTASKRANSSAPTRVRPETSMETGSPT